MKLSSYAFPVAMICLFFQLCPAFGLSGAVQRAEKGHPGAFYEITPPERRPFPAAGNIHSGSRSALLKETGAGNGKNSAMGFKSERAAWQRQVAARAADHEEANPLEEESNGHYWDSEGEIICGGAPGEFSSYHELTMLSSAAFKKALINLQNFLEEVDKAKVLSQKNLDKASHQISEAIIAIAENESALWDQHDTLMDLLEACFDESKSGDDSNPNQ